MEKASEILGALAQGETEEDQLRRRKQDAWYLIPEGEEPRRDFHSHSCRLCSEELEECGKDECYWTYEYICHKCYKPEDGLSSRGG